MRQPKHVTVRPFRPDEWERFRDVRLLALATDPQVFSSNLAREQAYDDALWQERLANPDGAVFAVLVGDELIGMTGVYVDRSRPRVAGLWGSWLEPEHRRQGHSTAMYEARIAWARAHPTVRAVQVSHRASNEASRRANQRHGFRHTHDHDHDWPDGASEPERSYVLDLDGPTSTVTRIWRRADRQQVPWKNGRGTTTELARSPAGESLDDFDWRLSMAPILEDGPFSSFPGIDRTLVLLDGADLCLELPDTELMLRVPGDLVRFDGEVAVHAHLGAGPVTDLNVMVRRSRYTHDAEVVRVAGPTPLGSGAPLIAVALGDRTRVGGLALSCAEAVGAEGRLEADGEGRVLVARLHPTGAP